MAKSPGAAIRSKIDSIQNNLMRTLEANAYLEKRATDYITAYYQDVEKSNKTIAEIAAYGKGEDKDLPFLKEFIQRDEAHVNIVGGMCLLKLLGAQTLELIDAYTDWYETYR